MATRTPRSTPRGSPRPPSRAAKGSADTAKKRPARKHLNAKQTAHLRGIAHDRKPIVLMGNKGLTEAVVKETLAALLAHELVKVKLPDADDVDAVATALARQTNAHLADRIGRMAVLYKQHPDKPRIRLPD